MTSTPRKIEKLRVVHDLQNQFRVSVDVRNVIESQLSAEERSQLSRFVAGFKIEDWFEWTFSAMPWVVLIHGLDQQQFPANSKSRYQVPDFLVVIETTALRHQPLLVEVKRVAREKSSLKLQNSQMDLCKSYASMLDLPMVFAIYWEKYNSWTFNTFDSFTRNSSTSKLPVAEALTSDCGLILGDVSYFLPQSFTRISRFSKKPGSSTSVHHIQHGAMESDTAVLGDNRVEMTSLESAVIDSTMALMTIRTDTLELVSKPS